MQKSPEFRSAYEQLTSGRIAYERASSKYEHAVSNFNSIVAVHREANLQLNQLKERFIEVSICSSTTVFNYIYTVYIVYEVIIQYFPLIMRVVYIKYCDYISTSI